eukprot:Skav203786  [mRNA]  locus=scaffold206:452032:455522:+ [translate_table: standard]
MVLLSVRAASQPLQRHQLPLSAWRKNSRSCLQLGDVRSFKESRRTGSRSAEGLPWRWRSMAAWQAAGDMDPLLCEVGGVLAAQLPGKVPRKELFEAHAVAQLVERHFPQERRITEFCAGCGLLGIFLMLLNPRRSLRCSDKKRQPLARGVINAQGRDAINAARVKALEEDGYEVWQDVIDPNISQMNLAILARPS